MHLVALLTAKYHQVLQEQDIVPVLPGDFPRRHCLMNYVAACVTSQPYQHSVVSGEAIELMKRHELHAPGAAPSWCCVMPLRLEWQSRGIVS